jgi:hypothetical protein
LLFLLHSVAEDAGGFLILISYATENLTEAARIAGCLRTSGHECWLAADSLPAGSEWMVHITKAIASSRALLVIVSAHADASPWVPAELALACSSGKPIIAVKLTREDPGEHIQLAVVKSSWIDASEEGVSDQILGHVASAVTTVMSNVEPAGPAPTRTIRNWGC